MNNINITKEIIDRIVCLILCVVITVFMPVIMIMFLIYGKRISAGVNLPDNKLM